MKINMNLSDKASSYDWSKSILFKSASAQINPPNVLFKNNGTAVKLTLSEEGKEAYRNQLKKQVENTNSEQIQYSKTHSDLIEFDRKWKNTLRPMLTGWGPRWMMDSYKPSDIFSEYASFYDEIVQGYQNGTREKYFEDADAEGGYRKATLEDELALLNEDFEKCLIRYKEQEERNAVLRAAIIKCAKQLEKSGNGHLEFVGRAKKLESEPVAPLPEDFVEKMHTAAKEFASQYMKKFSQQGSVDVSKLLNDVTVKHLDFLKKDKK